MNFNVCISRRSSRALEVERVENLYGKLYTAKHHVSTQLIQIKLL